jgi:hypothetical protein
MNETCVISFAENLADGVGAGSPVNSSTISTSSADRLEIF